MKIIQPSIEILTPLDGDYILKFLEQCGRTCYKSEDKITEDSAKKFIRNLIKRGHESVIEHFNITVKVICNRGISHEIVRHRIGAYSQESTRYVSYKDGIDVILPSHLIMPNDRVYEIWLNAMQDAEKHYRRLIDLEVKPEIARDVLPNALKTEIVITYNLRQWRHFLKQRTSKAAHPQIRQIAEMILKEFQEKIPVIFEDIGSNKDIESNEVMYKCGCRAGGSNIPSYCPMCGDPIAEEKKGYPVFCPFPDSCNRWGKCFKDSCSFDTCTNGFAYRMS